MIFFSSSNYFDFNNSSGFNDNRSSGFYSFEIPFAYGEPQSPSMTINITEPETARAINDAIYEHNYRLETGIFDRLFPDRNRPIYTCPIGYAALPSFEYLKSRFRFDRKKNIEKLKIIRL